MSGKSKEEKDAFVPRITQLDANEFDREIHNVLSTQLLEVNKYLKPGALNKLKHEINLAVDLLIFYHSVITKNSTFGQDLLNLKFKDLLSKNQVVLYLFLKYILPFLKNKYENYPNAIQSTTVKNSIDQFEVFFKICNFFNSLLFLREGKYPTIVDRLLKLRYSSVKKIQPAASYNYMTRELLWHGFTELLIHLLPLINYKAIKQKIRRLFLSKSPQIKHEKIIHNAETKCVICDDFPILPCEISQYCTHLACYYCLKSTVLADDKFTCPICGEINTLNDHLRFLTG